MRNGLTFLVTLEEAVGLTALAAELDNALGASFQRSTERGLTNKFFAEAFGMTLWLDTSEFAIDPEPPRFSLRASPTEEFDFDTTWVDIGPFVAELLKRRTGRPWTSVFLELA